MYKYEDSHEVMIIVITAAANLLMVAGLYLFLRGG